MLALDVNLPTAANRRATSVLVVDDDPALVNMLRENFLDEGHTVLCGYDGQMAIQMAKQSQPDLIVMDVNMPMTNGLKAFEFLRLSGDTATIPVIFVSGEQSSAINPVISGAPRVAHLKKPIDLDSLNIMARQFLEKYPVIR